MSDIFYRSDDAIEGGTRAIRKVTGRLVSGERVGGKFEKDQIEFKVAEAIIIEMADNQPEPELPEDTLTFWISYAKPGQSKAHKNTFYTKGWCKSAEAVLTARGNPKGSWQDLIGERITLEKQEIVLFKRTDKDTNEEEEITQENFVFVDEEATPTEDLYEYAAEKCVGKTMPEARRDILMDNRTKNVADIRVAAQTNKLAELLGLTLTDKGVFQREEPTNAKETESV